MSSSRYLISALVSAVALIPATPALGAAPSPPVRPADAHAARASRANSALALSLSRKADKRSKQALKLARRLVTSARILDGTVSAADIAADAVQASEIASDAVGASEIAADAVGASELANDAVGSAEIITDAVGASEIGSDAVGAGEIASDAVGAAEIAADAVGASEIAADAVAASEIAADAVSTSEIAADAVGASEIAADAVGSSEIATGAVSGGSGGDVSDGTLTSADLATGAAGETAYRLVASRSGAVDQSASSGDYWLPLGGEAVKEGVDSPNVAGSAAGAFYFDAADYAVTGRTTKLRLRAALATNGQASGVNVTVGLYPVTASGGGNNRHSLTLGTVVSGSTFTFTTPAADSTFQGNSGDFTPPASGLYAIGWNLSGTTGANSLVDATGNLQVHNCSGC